MVDLAGPASHSRLCTWCLCLYLLWVLKGSSIHLQYPTALGMLVRCRVSILLPPPARIRSVRLINRRCCRGYFSYVCISATKLPPMRIIMYSSRQGEAFAPSRRLLAGSKKCPDAGALRISFPLNHPSFIYRGAHDNERDTASITSAKMRQHERPLQAASSSGTSAEFTKCPIRVSIQQPTAYPFKTSS